MLKSKKLKIPFPFSRKERNIHLHAPYCISLTVLQSTEQFLGLPRVPELSVANYFERKSLKMQIPSQEQCRYSPYYVFFFLMKVMDYFQKTNNTV